MTSIRRNPHPSRHRRRSRLLRAILRSVRPDVVHGHGSKGGLFARLRAAGRAAADPRLYAARRQLQLRARAAPCIALYMAVERALARRTDLFLFESDHIRRKCDDLCRRARQPRARRRQRAQRRGVRGRDAGRGRRRHSLCRRIARGQGSRHAPGRACARWPRETGRAPTATLVGSGPDREALDRAGRTAGARRHVRFPGPHAGARGLRARARHGRAVARRIHALHRARKRGGESSAAHHRCRRNSGDLRPLSRPARPPRRRRRPRAPHRRGTASPGRRSAARAPPNSPPMCGSASPWTTWSNRSSRPIARRWRAAISTPDRRAAAPRRRASCQRGVTCRGLSANPLRKRPNWSASASSGARGAPRAPGYSRILLVGLRAGLRLRASSRLRALRSMRRMSCSRSARSRSISCWRFGVALINVLRLSTCCRATAFRRCDGRSASCSA